MKRCAAAMAKRPPNDFPDRSHGEVWTDWRCPCCNRCYVNQWGKCPYGGPFRGYEERR